MAHRLESIVPKINSLCQDKTRIATVYYNVHFPSFLAYKCHCWASGVMVQPCLWHAWFFPVCCEPPQPVRSNDSNSFGIFEAVGFWILSTNSEFSQWMSNILLVSKHNKNFVIIYLLKLLLISGRKGSRSGGGQTMITKSSSFFTRLEWYFPFSFFFFLKIFYSSPCSQMGQKHQPNSTSAQTCQLGSAWTFPQPIYNTLGRICLLVCLGTCV